MHMAKDKNKFTYLEKVAIGIIVVLILIIVLLVFDENIKEYFEIFKEWYEKG